MTNRSTPNAFHTQLSRKREKMNDIEQEARIKGLDFDNKIKAWTERTAWIQLVVAITTALSAAGAVAVAGFTAYHTIHYPRLR